MPTNVPVKINQKEYLKKYLSGSKAKKKKKEKKRKREPPTSVQIIDDDLSYVDTGPKIDEELLLTGDDAPQIVGEYVEERSADQKASKWRSIAVKDEIDIDGKVEVKREEDMWGRKSGTWKLKDELSPTQKPQSYKRKHNTAPRKPDEEKGTLNAESAKTKSGQRSIKIEKRKEKSSSRDQSPPRRRRKSISSDQSPIRRVRRDSDQSPPRKRHSSPVRRRRRNSRQSPPQQSRRDSEQSVKSPKKGPSSPIRRERRSSLDQSPPRRRWSSSLQSSSSRRKDDRRQTPVCIKREKRTPNRHSPQERQQSKRESSSPPSRHSRWEKPLKSISPPPTHKPKSTKTLDGKKAGLQDAKSLQAETEERRRHEERLFAEMSNDISGRDADVQVRSTGRRGKRARDAQAEDPETVRRKEALALKKQHQYDRWGKGLKQIEEHQARRAAQEYEGSKPLARYSNDEDLDRHLRQQERADDPMLAYIREKNKERQKAANLPSVPLYEGPFPENRYGIRPGYRWDGVDRSNGYEKKWFDVQNEKRAVQDEAYKYSVEDM